MDSKAPILSGKNMEKLTLIFLLVIFMWWFLQIGYPHPKP